MNKTQETNSMKHVPIEFVKVDWTKNPRKNYKDMETICEFHRHHGNFEIPISVRQTGPEEYELTHGYRRMLSAHLLAGKEIPAGIRASKQDGKPIVGKLYTEAFTIASVPVQIMGASFDEMDELLSHFSQNTGEKLDALESAETFALLEVAGMKQAEIAQALGITQPSVCNGLKLATLCKESEFLRNVVQDGKIAPTELLKVLSEAKGNAKKTEQAIKIALGVAKARGKSKVTAKDTGSKKPVSPTPASQTPTVPAGQTPTVPAGGNTTDYSGVVINVGIFEKRFAFRRNEWAGSKRDTKPQWLDAHCFTGEAKSSDGKTHSGLWLFVGENK